MRRWLSLLLTVSAHAQSPAAGTLLGQVKAHVAGNLRRLPDYTCTETIDRSLRAKKRGQFQPLQHVRINVAYVGGKELFGFPGTGRVAHANIEKLVSGPIGNGQFALFVRDIFLGSTSTITSPSKVKLNGEDAFRFDYRVPTGLQIQSSVAERIVGYRGSFWIARDSLNLKRLIVAAAELPPHLEMVSDVTTIDYAPVTIAGKQFGLPMRSVWDMKDIFGSQVRSTMTFGSCREYVGESSLKFDDTTPQSNK
jgi:hypothetical protein